jgi:hypothetical protein
MQVKVGDPKDEGKNYGLYVRYRCRIWRKFSIWKRWVLGGETLSHTDLHLGVQKLIVLYHLGHMHVTIQPNENANKIEVRSCWHSTCLILTVGKQTATIKKEMCHHISLICFYGNVKIQIWTTNRLEFCKTLTSLKINTWIINTTREHDNSRDWSSGVLIYSKHFVLKRR